MTMATRVKKLREKLGLTQQQLANRLGSIPVTISRWETGKTVPTGSSIDKIERLERGLKHSSADVKALRKKCLRLGLLQEELDDVLSVLAQPAQEAVLRAILHDR